MKTAILTVLATLLLAQSAGAAESCKEIIGGRKNNVTSYMCIVTSGARIGDLLVKFTRDDLSHKRRIHVEDCSSKFSDAPNWGMLAFNTGGLLIDYRASKKTEWYILTSGLTAAQRASWLSFSSDACLFSVEDLDGNAASAPQSGISGTRECPAFTVMGASGCEPILQAN